MLPISCRSTTSGRPRLARSSAAAVLLKTIRESESIISRESGIASSVSRTSWACSPLDSNNAEIGSIAFPAVIYPSLRGASDADDDATRLLRLPQTNLTNYSRGTALEFAPQFHSLCHCLFCGACNTGAADSIRPVLYTKGNGFGYISIDSVLRH